MIKAQELNEDLTMSNGNDSGDITIHELARSMQNMADSMSKLSDDLGTLLESDIRRQERETRQQELNQKTDRRLTEIEKWKHSLEISRAKESPGREFLMKYWAFFFVFGSIIVWKVGKTGITSLLP